MKIVIISDLHGNLEALASLPEEYDELWVLGDLVNCGPNPAEVVDSVRAKASVVVRRNPDYSLGFGGPSLMGSPSTMAFVVANKARLRSGRKANTRRSTWRPAQHRLRRACQRTPRARDNTAYSTNEAISARTGLKALNSLAALAPATPPMSAWFMWM